VDLEVLLDGEVIRSRKELPVNDMSEKSIVAYAWIREQISIQYARREERLDTYLTFGVVIPAAAKLTDHRLEVMDNDSGGAWTSPAVRPNLRPPQWLLETAPGEQFGGWMVVNGDQHLPRWLKASFRWSGAGEDIVQARLWCPVRDTYGHMRFGVAVPSGIRIKSNRFQVRQVDYENRKPILGPWANSHPQVTVKWDYKGNGAPNISGHNGWGLEVSSNLIVLDQRDPLYLNGRDYDVRIRVS
jgi:hypothetical protein